MSDELKDSVLDGYFRSQRELVSAEQVDSDNVIVSFPFHFSGGHRVELNVTAIPMGKFYVSDMAQTIGELKQSGYGITKSLRSRIEEIAAAARIKVVRDYLTAEYTQADLGTNLHLFAEAAKTIGDVYLVHKHRQPATEEQLHKRVREVLLRKQYVFREFEQVGGTIESHKLDFFIPPNGTAGLGLAVLAHPTRLLAEAWAFKAQDLKNAIKRFHVGLVYDETIARDESRDIISKMIDVPVPAKDLESLPGKLANLLGH